MRNGLTLKEYAFSKAFVATQGNGTQAVLQSYGTTNPDVARSIAPEVLARSRVQSEILRLLDQAGLTDQYLTEQHAHVVGNCKSTDPALVGTGMRAVSLAYRLKGYLDRSQAAQAQQLPPTLVNVVVQVLGEMGQAVDVTEQSVQVPDNADDS